MSSPNQSTPRNAKNERYDKLWEKTVEKVKKDEREENEIKHVYHQKGRKVPSLLESYAAATKKQKHAPKEKIVLTKTIEAVESGSDSINVIEEMDFTMGLSSLIYAFAKVRQTIRRGGVRNSWWNPFAGRTQIPNSDLIIRKCNDGEGGGDVCNTRIPAEDISKVLTPETMKLYANDLEIANELNVYAIRQMKQYGQDAYLWEFDDKFANSQLVYGVTVNRRLKRVTVIFRGSVVSRDWLTNIQIFLKPMKIPEAVNPNILYGDRKIRVHTGFKKYLLDDIVENKATDVNNAERIEALEKKKYGQILKHLSDIYDYEVDGVKVHKDFKLYVTGHSLGAALSTLLAFRLAGSNGMIKRNIPFPLTCISYASPYVGDRNFSKAFEELERQGRLRHIRVTNENDVVPVAPPGGYVHTGLNIHFLRGSKRTNMGEPPFVSSYGNQAHSWLSQFPWAVGTHFLTRYWSRGQNVKEWYMAQNMKTKSSEQH
ncbi:hypothetical protein ACA910_007234 [Epithemia clementina (nom. ined.)]